MKESKTFSMTRGSTSLGRRSLAGKHALPSSGQGRGRPALEEKSCLELLNLWHHRRPWRVASSFLSKTQCGSLV